jgi:hypothetical protein
VLAENLIGTGVVNFFKARGFTGIARQVTDRVLSPKFITDLSASYQLPRRTFGSYRFSGLSPFGFNGRYLLARFSVGL